MIVNWYNELEKKLVKKGLSLYTEEAILLTKKEFFNDCIRAIMLEHPKLRLFNMIMSLQEHYDPAFLAKNMLDEYHKIILTQQASEDYNL